MKRTSPLFIVLLFILVPFLSRAQSLVPLLSGKVTDEKGQALPGATVAVKGTAKGAVTNVNGQFSLKDVPANASLLVSFQGYQNTTIELHGQSSVAVTLNPDISKLNDVIVVGYGSQQKIASTGSIASVKGADITQTPVTNVAQGLAARVPGVQITQNNAAPGGNISVRIRGTNSINGSSEPLYIIDGIQISNSGGVNDVSPLSTINPNDIESVEILKDASSTAIYGARGANGVVLITTKRGKSGATRVQLDMYRGIQNITRKLSMLNASQFAQLENDIYNSKIYDDPASLGQGTNWQDVIYRQANVQNYQASVSGGSNKTQFSMSGNFFDQEGIIISSDFKRYSFRATIDHTISDHFKVGTSLQTSYTINNSIPTGINSIDGPLVTQSIVGATLGAPPTLIPYREDGTVYPFADQFNGRYREIANPVGLSQILNRNTIRRTLANLYAEAKIVKGLTYRASLNADMGNTLNDYYSPIYILGKAEVNANSGTASKGNVNTTNWLHESVLTYNRDFGAHSLKFTGVYAIQSNMYNDNTINANGLPNDATQNEAVQLAVNRTVSSNRSKESLTSYMGRINYGYADKYFLDITARYDGASKFGENHKWGFFPAVAGAWRIIEEPFLKNSRVFSDLKLRASFGQTGNAGAISPYQSLALEGSGSNYQFNHIYTVGISPTGIPNADLRWEKSTQANVGVDIGLFEDRLSIVADLYNKKTKDLLFVKNLPLSSGYTSITGNFASIRNKGVEIAANARLLTGKLKWNMNVNFSVNRNELLSLEGGMNEFVLSPYSVLRVGQPLGIFKTYVFNGIYQTGETVLPGSGSRIGGVKVADLNNDKQITGDDQTITGNANPSFLFGLSSNFTYRNFDLSFFLSGVQGNKVFNLSRYTFENGLGGRNVLEGLVNRWSPTNPSNEYANGFQGGRLPISDRFVEDGSYIRMKNITLGYKLPPIKYLTNVRVYVSANNLFTITNYSGYDPEVNSFGGSNTLIGVDNLVYPMSRSFLVGLQVGF
ncbi:TonB-linked outer membrane protein, SusC/RagA family [Chitinophaga terrae (ex Kim and Jung 2007)]|uniref:TonB-linked outer membrane protein, SusC/RagA family n=1 Tax=Chitinophaga terrae (ex Kim and Jung 2007) TaxID=408074 RepID=A0A1H3YJF7_9BACT|nr:TonB-dependent receptor [Chitinophaga terrae (ex Kim and Jung 2007)]MDQ0108653.1 TonB-linked SusC/RagA family outer membrane protein [Chitinophaga terrae (ex Kim and Jung 2007)]SEA11759.1 TonB-linked outer membrane protein, SusC/RagA family [Chitinophaga terrae (ex Kim and Jung 2007)]